MHLSESSGSIELMNPIGVDEDDADEPMRVTCSSCFGFVLIVFWFVEKERDERRELVD